MAIKTVLVSQWFPPEPVQLPLAICQALERRGHSVEVLTGVPNYPTGEVAKGYSAWRSLHEYVNGINIHRSPLYPNHDSSAIKRMLNYISWAMSSTAFGFKDIRTADVALVYSSPATAALAPMVWRRLAGTPYVLMLQDLWPDSVLATGFLSKGLIGRIADKVLSSFCNWSYKSAAHITVISPGAIELLESRGVPRDKLSLVYNWADESTANSEIDTSAARAEFGLPPSAFVLSYAGNLGAAQGLDVVLRSASEIRDLDDVYFLFVGDGLETESLKTLARELGCERVSFAGRVPFEKMSSVQAASNIQLISLNDNPLFRITMPSKVQSTLASGTSVVAIAAGDAAHIIEQSGAGWSVAPGDHQQLASVIRNAHAEGPDKLAKRGQAGRDYYQRHMSEAVGSGQLDKVLQAVANSSTSRKSTKAREGSARGFL